MKRVLLKFYHSTNMGDDLFIHIVTARYRDTFSVVLRHPSPGIEGIPNLHHRANRAILFGSRVVGRLVRDGDWRVLDRYERHVARSHDVLVQVGGSMFIEASYSRKQWERQIASILKLGRPYYILGANYGPQLTTRFFHLIDGLLASAADVCFRDRSSYRTFAYLPSTRVASDIVFSMNVDDLRKSTNGAVANGAVAVISIVDASRHVNGTGLETYERVIAQLTVNLVRHHYRVIYMSFCAAEGDEEAADSILSRLPDDVATTVGTHHYRGDLNAALDQLASADLIVATRFHAAVLGLLLGKRVFPIAYSEKTLDMLRDLSFEGAVADLRDLDDFDGALFDFSGVTTHDVSEQVASAHQQFERLDEILTRTSGT